MSTRKSSKAAKPAILPVRRDYRFNLPKARINDWHEGGGPIFTAFLNTFSIVLPVGERFFIDAVRAHRDQITDPELKKAVTAFIGQEAMHGREHEDYNELVFANNAIAPRFEKLVANLLGFLQNNTAPSFRLSGTIALEHFTALLADMVLREPALTAQAESHFRALWQWHALEETEHKAVAYDVWNAVMGRGLKAYALRSSGQALATVVFWALTLPTFLKVVQENGQLGNFKAWRQFARYTLGDVGLIRRLVLPWADYFRSDFHPWDHDNRAYLDQMATFDQQMQTMAA